MNNFSKFITCPNSQAKILPPSGFKEPNVWVQVLTPSSIYFSSTSHRCSLLHPSHTSPPFSGLPCLDICQLLGHPHHLARPDTGQKKRIISNNLHRRRKNRYTLHSFTKKWEIIDLCFLSSCKKQAA